MKGVLRLSPTLTVLLALVLAAVCGIVMRHVAPALAAQLAAVLHPLGKLWISALQMTVVPLVGALVALGVGNARDAAASGRIARRALLVFGLVLTCATSLAALLAPLVFARFTPSADLARVLSSGEAVTQKAPAAADFLVNIIPSNAVAAAAQGAMLPLVVFSLFFGFALTRIEPERAGRMFDLLQALADAMIQIVRWVLAVAPCGVFALVFALAAQTGLDMLRALGTYLVVDIAMYLMVTLAMYPLVAVFGRDSAGAFARAALPAQTVAMSTQSSLASLPAMLETTLDRLRHPRAVPSLVLPMAVSLFRLTSPVQYITVAAFIAWSHGLEVGAAQWATAVLLAVVISLGSVGLPGQASFMATNLPVTQALGLPVQPLALLLAVDTLPDIFATLGNVTGDMAATSIVAKGESGSGEGTNAPPRTPDAHMAVGKTIG